MTHWGFHAGAALFFGIALFLPALEVYTRNADELPDGMTLLAAPASMAALGIGLALLFSIAMRFRPSALRFVIAATILLIAANIMFPGVTPPLDGGMHDFSIDRMKAAAELVTFLLVAASALFLLFRHLKVTVWATYTLVLLAVSLPLSQFLADRFFSAPSQASTDLAELMSLSDDLNVIHIMFDSLQSDAFHEILEDHPDLKKAFSGFTYYPDHAGYSNWTTLSIPAVQAGRAFFDDHQTGRDVHEEIAGWLRSDSIMAKLHDRRYSVAVVQPAEVFCDDMPFNCTTLPRLSDLLKKQTKRRSIDTDPLLLTNLALLRIAPTALKPYVFAQGKLLRSPENDTPVERDIMSSVDLARIVADGLGVSNDRPTYRFLHFYPPHKPFILDEECRAGPPGHETWEEYLPQATCAVRLIATILRRIKELGIYDNTIIVVEADTGLGMVKRPDPMAEPVSSVVAYTAGQLIGYARPLLAVKPLGSKGPLTISDRRTSHLDTFRLIEEASASRIDLPKMDDARSRRFVVSNIVRKGSNEVVPYESFVINGATTDFSRWQAEGIFLQQGIRSKELTPIASAVLDVKGSIPAHKGETLYLTASSKGGRVEKEYLFFRRLERDIFDVIQPWSEDKSAIWHVEAGGRSPCIAELLLAVRNKVQLPGEETVTVEKSVPVNQPDCF